jgi:hypothetical protein
MERVNCHQCARSCIRDDWYSIQYRTYETIPLETVPFFKHEIVHKFIYFCSSQCMRLHKKAIPTVTTGLV